MMRTGRAFASLVFLLSVTAVAVRGQRQPIVDTAQTQTSVVVRQELIENLPGRSILIALDPSKLPQPGAQFADGARIDFPESVRGSADVLPNGWTAKFDGKTFTAGGPVTDSVSIRVLPTDPGSVDKMIGKQCRIRLSLGGREFLDQRIPISAIQATPVITGTLPAVVTAGRGMWGSIDKGVPQDVQPHLVYDGGKISTVLLPTEYSTLDKTRFALRPSFVGRFKVSENDSPQPAEFKIVWYDRFRYPLAEINSRMVVMPEQSCTGGVAGGDRLAFAGQNVCVTGCLSDDAKALSALLDGGRELTPVAGAGSSWMFQVPADATPGPHTIDFKGGGTHQVGVLAVEGAIDQNELWRGTSTTMRLRVIGSEERLPLRITNKTPSTITITGGVSQIIDSPGGAANAITRSVTGIRKGNFNIEYSLNLPACGVVPPVK